MNYLAQAAASIVPLFILISSGFLLKKKGVLNANFVSIGSQIVFKLALPALIIRSLAVTNLSELGSLPLFLSYLAATLVSTVVVLAVSFFVSPPDSRGPVVHGAFRGNVVIVGLALVQSALGNEAFILGLGLVAVFLPLYNLMASVALSLPYKGEGSPLKGVLVTIVKIPLIWSVVIGALWSLSGWQIPVVIDKSLEYFGRLALPLGFLTIGANLSIHGLDKRWKGVVAAVTGKLILNPLVALLVGRWLGVDTRGLIVLFLMAGSPTAISSFAMTKAMGRDADTAGDIVALSTAVSFFTLTVGLTLLLPML
ncbi:MAG: AEC family transporter [Spirochaetaceae bacterium]|nr:AEC family transporter [Spirochaetaceae bacterium]RKX85966.1 MAG: hypothetical protein DRP70_10890 [Spirochaetota bacterium]